MSLNTLIIVMTLISFLICPGVNGAGWDNPGKTDEQDIVLPLGNSVENQWAIVMRRLAIPGRDFWLSGERFIDLGQGGDANVYERPVSVEIRGISLSKSQWYIWIGKYEISVGQYVHVIGNNDIEIGLNEYQRESNLEFDIANLLENKKELVAFLSKPVQRMPPASIGNFLRRLNLLCYEYEPCRTNLPDLGQQSSIDDVTYLPFFRLPNEIEWEYAARGVSVKRHSYRNRLPVSEKKLENYAQLKNIRSIGQKKPVFGFYDMFGNVAELIDSRMSSEIGSLGTGSWIAKGGKAGRSFNKFPYSSMREEIAEFEWDKGTPAPEPSSFAKIGFRLALGSPLQAFNAMAQSERPKLAEIRIPELGESDANLTQDFAAILESLSTPATLNAESLENLNGQLRSALERLKNKELKNYTRLAAVIGDNALTKLIRIWALHTRVLKANETLQMYPDVTSLSERRRTSLRRISERSESDNSLLTQLNHEYEIGVRALADIPGVNAKSIELLDLTTFDQSGKTAQFATQGAKLLQQQISELQADISTDIQAQVIKNYPLR